LFKVCLKFKDNKGKFFDRDDAEDDSRIEIDRGYLIINAFANSIGDPANLHARMEHKQIKYA